MASRWRRARTLLVAVVHEVRAEKLTFVAGSIAYHAFVSLLPLLLLVLALLTAVGDRSLQQGFLALTRAVLTPGAGEVLVAELRAAGASAGVSLFGLAVLVWGTLRIFRGLDTAFSAIYETEAENTFLDQVTDGAVVFVAFALALAVAAAIESAIPAGSGAAAWLLTRLALVAGLCLVLYPIYYVFPDEDVGAVEVLPGVAFAAVGLTTFGTAFRAYLDYSAGGPERSVVAAILLLLTWLYFSGLVVLLGAAINAVTSNRSRDVNVEPLLGGVPVDARADRESRGRIVAAAGRLDAVLPTAGEVVVEADGERVVLPPPAAVRVDTGGPGVLGAGTGAVTVELRWMPGEE